MVINRKNGALYIFYDTFIQKGGIKRVVNVNVNIMVFVFRKLFVSFFFSRNKKLFVA